MLRVRSYVRLNPDSSIPGGSPFPIRCLRVRELLKERIKMMLPQESGHIFLAALFLGIYSVAIYKYDNFWYVFPAKALVLFWTFLCNSYLGAETHESKLRQSN